MNIPDIYAMAENPSRPARPTVLDDFPLIDGCRTFEDFDGVLKLIGAKMFISSRPGQVTTWIIEYKGHECSVYQDEALAWWKAKIKDMLRCAVG